ncbi:hypothetical protein ACV34M_31350, partial [Pseudomonas aeruginosa]
LCHADGHGAAPEQHADLLGSQPRVEGKHGGDYDFEPADAEDLTAPILPSERGYRLDHRDVGRSARLDMQKALDLAVKSRERVR